MLVKDLDAIIDRDIAYLVKVNNVPTVRSHLCKPDSKDIRKHYNETIVKVEPLSLSQITYLYSHNLHDVDVELVADLYRYHAYLFITLEDVK